MNHPRRYRLAPALHVWVGQGNNWRKILRRFGLREYLEYPAWHRLCSPYDDDCLFTYLAESA